MYGLEKYQTNGHFFFTPKDELENVCNASNYEIGVYVVHALKNGKIEMVYIGSSDKSDQEINSGMNDGGLFNSIVNGLQFGESRKNSWKKRLKYDKIEALDVYWFVTSDKLFSDIPLKVREIAIQTHINIMGELPKWNKEE